MQRKTLWFTFWILACSYCIAHAGEAESREHKVSQLGVKGHYYVTGTVSRITDGAVFLKTGELREREFTIKEAHREKIKGLKVGDRITLELDEGDLIIDLSRGNAQELKGLEKKNRFVKGEVVGYEPLKKVVTLKLKDGEMKSYAMKDAAATYMNDIKMRTGVVLEIDKENNLVEDVKVQGEEY